MPMTRTGLARLRAAYAAGTVHHLPPRERPAGYVPMTVRHEPDRDTLGRRVRDAWIGWAREQPTPKPSWLAPWEELSEADREADRRIGEAIYTYAMSGVPVTFAADPAALTDAEREELAAAFAEYRSRTSGDVASQDACGVCGKHDVVPFAAPDDEADDGGPFRPRWPLLVSEDTKRALLVDLAEAVHTPRPDGPAGDFMRGYETGMAKVMLALGIMEAASPERKALPVPSRVLPWSGWPPPTGAIPPAAPLLADRPATEPTPTQRFAAHLRADGDPVLAARANELAPDNTPLVHAMHAGSIPCDPPGIVRVVLAGDGYRGATCPVCIAALDQAAVTRHVGWGKVR